MNSFKPLASQVALLKLSESQTKSQACQKGTWEGRVLAGVERKRERVGMTIARKTLYPCMKLSKNRVNCSKKGVNELFFTPIRLSLHHYITITFGQGIIAWKQMTQGWD